jgi:predicted AlkP superfamily pyrophosphatase or phosphodiesterase
MTKSVALLSIPGLRCGDLDAMPRLSALLAGGERASLTPSFPGVTWPVQANMLTGQLPAVHGVIGNGFFWRDQRRVEMWTAWNDKITAPQIWDRLHQQSPQLTSAVWFPMLSKGCGADYVCMPAPIHHPDGGEELWCYTQPRELYGDLRDRWGHFPLQHFWGPLAGIQATAWIAASAVHAAERFRPNFFYLYLPHLDYAAQRSGPDSPAAQAAVAELDAVIGSLAEGFAAAYADAEPLWIAASEYVITPVSHVSYPNRSLRDAGLLAVREEADGEHLDLEASRAWALVDHQFSHVFVRDADPDTQRRVVELFRGVEGIAEILAGDDRARYKLNHPRSGEVILISEPHSWQAYYWWLDDRRAPGFARTVDIHRKPGYDPVELLVDMPGRTIPLDASRIQGSHGAPVASDRQRGVIAASRSGVLTRSALADVDVCELVLRQFAC